ncbi:MAG TPA: tripartite tricarboxylate transporter substrate binding protein [Burkholderiales bacterium]|nr:tripartite tricarboxylate transporter substrate binding protein [Burkholderiales bacterium]
MKILSALTAVALTISPAFAAQKKADPVGDYPNKPVRWIIDFGAGGLSDTLARIVAMKVSDMWKQPIINQARPGANGTIAYDIGAKATPDGYTLVFVSTPFSVNPSVYTNLPYDTRKDFAAVTLIAMYPNILVVNPKVPVKSVQELISYAKSKQGGPTWATVGVGSSPFLATELFRKQTGFDGIHVPYNSSPQALTDLAGGRIEFMFVNMPTAVGFIKGNRIRAIGIASPARSVLMPDLPTIAESGVPGFQSVGYAGAATQSKVPRAIVEKINADMVKALHMSDVQEQIRNLGGEPRHSTTAEFQKLLNDEIARWAPVAREAGVKLER